MSIRAAVVDRLVHASDDPAGFNDAAEVASGEEFFTAAQILTRDALSKPPPPLSWSMHQALRLACQGYAIAKVADFLAPSWAAWPDRGLGDVLKVEPAHRVEHVRETLAAVGLRLDT